MKRLIFAGLVALFTGTIASAQNNGGYVDDVYYNGTQAQQDAKVEAKKQKDRPQQSDAEYYNSSGSNDNYNNGDAQVYNSSYSSDDEYIDYDDDSYTSRIRRFYYPMYNVGYWGSVYSPFWYDPFFMNPYYGWGSWYTPGFSVGIGWGGGPYWNGCWGINTWFGYGGFNSWYYPYGGWGWGPGWGYGAGYWNGYYAGLYDGGYNYRTPVYYGPRGARNGMVNGAYGRNANMRAANTGNNMMLPMNGRNANMNNRVIGNANSGRDAMQVDGQRVTNMNRGIGRNDAIRLDNNNRAVEINSGAVGRQSQMQEAPARRGGFFNNIFGGGNSERVNRSADFDRGSQRNYNVEQRSMPSRSYNVERSAPQPSRSFSSPAPSRSFGGGGGGARMSSGRR